MYIFIHFYTYSSHTLFTVVLAVGEPVYSVQSLSDEWIEIDPSFNEIPRDTPVYNTIH